MDVAIKTIRMAVHDVFGSNPEVAAVYLFGSEARGEAGPGSDVDLAVLHRRRPAATLAGRHYDAADRLTEVLGRRVDVMVLDDAPVDVVHRVLRDGVLVYESDPAARVRFEVRARNDYFDILPHLMRYRRRARP